MFKGNKGIRGFLLSESEWENVHHLVNILQPFDKYTKSLQSEQVTLSDFFGYWTMLRIKLAKAQDELSKNLLLETNQYHEMLMENPAILAAVFLDPRYQRGLKEKQALDIQFLVNLYMRMQEIEKEPNQPEIIEVDVINYDSDSYEDMDDYLNACSSVMPSPMQQNVTTFNNSTTNNNNNNEEFITELLTQFIGIRDSLKKTIWEIWESKKRSDPELYHLAKTVFSIPPTQTTVERGFSSLPIILNSHRTRIGDNTLEDILFVRLNRDLIDTTENEEV